LNDEKMAEARSMLVRRWGEMALYWGVSRTMAEVHALLFISPRPLCTDEIMQELSISRGNARCDASVWETFETIARQRKKREMEPILETLRKCRDLALQAERTARKPETRTEARQSRERLEEMLGFIELVAGVIESFLRSGPESLRQIAAMVEILQGGSEGDSSE